jgi:hypothetical protein
MGDWSVESWQEPSDFALFQLIGSLQGSAVAMERNNTTGADKAPRTAVGIDSEGRLMLLVADGCQKW